MPFMGPEFACLDDILWVEGVSDVVDRNHVACVRIVAYYVRSVLANLRDLYRDEDFTKNSTYLPRFIECLKENGGEAGLVVFISRYNGPAMLITSNNALIVREVIKARHLWDIKQGRHTHQPDTYWEKKGLVLWHSVNLKPLIRINRTLARYR